MEATTVLLVSRGTMSGAQRIGECLARHEGIRYVTREDLLAAVSSYGDLANRIATQLSRAETAYEEFSELRRPYQILMRRALLEYARQGHLAYFGYSGHMLLRRAAHFVRVRLIAPLEMRVARARQRLGCSESEGREYIHREDQERARWARMMYGVDIRDPTLYDVCLNIERLSLEGACDLLRKAMQQMDFQPTADSITQVEEDYVAAQALAVLVTDPRTMRLELGASASCGSLHLVGPYLPDADVRTVLSIANSVPGVNETDYRPGYSLAFQYAS